MEFRILGPLEVLDDGRPLDLGGAKQRALLAVLLLHANEVVSTDALIDALWEEEAPGSGRKALQVYVSGLRKALGKERLQTRSPGYVLRVEEGELDLERFQRLAADGGAADALALWRGQPLAEFAYQRFAQGEITRLEELRLACLEDRIEADLAAGRHAALVAELEALVAEHPLRERLRAQLMLALYRSGRQAEALESYQNARQALVEELGIDPGKQLRDLQQAILRQEPGIELVPTPELSGAVEPARGIFVGRETELEELRAGLDEAIAGRGSVCLLVGEPGIGKSRLTEELIRHAQERGVTVLVGRCWEAGGAPAFWPWVQSIRAYVEQVESDAVRAQLGSGASDVAQIVPELRELYPALPEPAGEDEGARFRLFDAAARFFRNAAVARPLVLVLDDLHAADEPSLLLLRFVASHLGGSRILVVGTYRDVDPTVRDPLASTLAELAREPVTRRIELSGLTEANVGRYIELSVEAVPSGALVSAIHGETEGNPLFVGEVVRLLASEGRLLDVDADAMWTLGVPQGVREVIGRRLRQLSDECASALTLASALGREFGLDAVESVAELPRDELLTLLDEALQARLLASVPEARGRLRFAHALIRETLYESLTTPRRVQLHRRAGEALERLYAANPEPHLAELAYHFFEAAPGGDVDKALAYTRAASEHALRVLAYEEAARFCDLALQSLELQEPFDPDLRCELLLARGDALGQAGNTPDAKKTFVAAAELARRSGLPQHLSRAALGYGGRFVFGRAGRDTVLVPLLEEALAALEEDDSVLRTRLLARLAGALRDEPSLERRSSLARGAVAMARRLGDDDVLAYALVGLAWAAWEPDVEPARAIVDEVRRIAEKSGDPQQAFQSGWLEYVVLMTMGETDRVTTWIDRYRPLADELKQPHAQWLATVPRSAAALLHGDLPGAERLMEDALRLGERAQTWDAGFSYRITLVLLRREQGRLAQVDDLLRQAVDDYPGYRAFRCLAALAAQELGRTQDARAMLDVLAESEFSALPRDIEWVFCLAILSEVASSLRDRDRAAKLYSLLLPFGHLNAVEAGEVAIGSVSRYLGLLASTGSNWADAERHFEDALAMNERMAAWPWLAHTQEDYARMLFERDEPGDRERGEELLGAAVETYRELGMDGPLAKATAAAAR